MRRNNFLFLTAVTLLITLSTLAEAADNFNDIHLPGITASSIKITQPLSQLRQSAEQGDAKAQFVLAYAYSHGEQVEQNQATAVKWFSKAASQGFAPAQYKLALMLEYGQGVIANHIKAAYWHQQAANQGNVGAQHSLGMMYKQGKGLTEDKIAAYTWLSLAAVNGFDEVASARDHIANQLNDAKLAQAQLAFGQLKIDLASMRSVSWVEIAKQRSPTE